MKTLEVKKGQILQFKGELNTKVYRVEEGLLRSYSVDEKGKEHIFVFAPEGWILADNVSAQDESELYIDALEDSRVVVYSKEMEKDHDVKKLFKRISVLQQRVIMLMSSSAIERYEHFVQTYPDVSHRVPQRMIASYLGITPEALSKVKGERRRKK